MDMITETHNSKETYELGFNMGKSAKAGDVYCLDGDLGVGKTVFTQRSEEHTSELQSP